MLLVFQPELLRFHEAIKHDNFDESPTLRKQRDIVLNRLRERCQHPFTTFDMGGFTMNTGVIPLDKDFDIDVGVVFKANPLETRPEFFKNLVFEAVNGLTPRVEWRNPCITVYSQNSRKGLYHVDLCVYVEDEQGKLHLAMGKQDSSDDAKVWQPGDPREFIKAMHDTCKGEEALQMFRIIRYLKRWKDVNFPAPENASPKGITLTVAAYHWYQPIKIQGAIDSNDFNDMAALLKVVRSMRARFYYFHHRLQVRMPFDPKHDLLHRFSHKEMQAWEDGLSKLDSHIDDALNYRDVRCLVPAFGPEIMPEDTRTRRHGY